ncbi:polyisoprenoid-binding protein YceI [Prauserella shujinwangii]|uniref:Polyisoprenoid-binding protein YceI n=1 Tax=Prauserella shujinwangii TaxID=1453103 RepID=A0A2T0LUI7_9PSEU|nr:YceI family protein [Prauserella shujinwangii]PRX47510.1 polyisoprenoid-binding protein YceI [Prauserella shujinwangii]
MSGLRGIVRSAGGWGVGHAVLTVTDLAGRQLALTHADDAGGVATEPLPPGVCTAVVTANGFLPAARTVHVAGDGSASLGEVALEAEAESVELPPPGPWVIDPVHSSVVVTARHLGIASVKARFPDVGGRIVVERPVERSTVHAAIAAASVDTGVKPRDDHLRSADFLDVERYPEIGFAGTSLRRRGADSWVLGGELSLHGRCREIELDLSYGGYGPDPWGGVRAAFHAETQLRRDDFAIDYSAVVRAGVAAIGTAVKVELDIQAVQGEKLPEF